MLCSGIAVVTDCTSSGHKYSALAINISLLDDIAQCLHSLWDSLGTQISQRSKIATDRNKQLTRGQTQGSARSLKAGAQQKKTSVTDIVLTTEPTTTLDEN